MCLTSPSAGSSPDAKDVSPKRSSPWLSARKILRVPANILNCVTGTEKLEGFNLLKIFSETFRPRTLAEVEEHLTVGTARTSPPLLEIPTDWPKPWLFAGCFLLFSLAYLGFLVAYMHFNATDLAPGLILMGAFAGPISTLVLFFELNVPRNVSMYRLILLIGLGGTAALLISFAGYNVARLGWLTNAGAGVIEEMGKLAALLLLTRGWPNKYILNGMLFGAAVGAGFAAFESAGYAFQICLDSGGGTAMMANLVERGVLAPLMHVTWTAMVGAALWRARGDKPLSLTAVIDRHFYGVLGLVIALHTVWNITGDAVGILKAMSLGVVAWYVTLGLVQQGLRQIRDEQCLLRSVIPSVRV
jgi:RsiW-degrading membrane proteinase PrsW (M82 family)